MHSIDLNLLTALDALLNEGSVLGAAKRMNLSAPAMSRTLGGSARPLATKFSCAPGDAWFQRRGRLNCAAASAA